MSTEFEKTIEEYLNIGWKIVPLLNNSKTPMKKSWNVLSNVVQKKSDISLIPTRNIGLAHAYSGTMSFDIDDYDETKVHLAELGINLDELYNAPDAVIIDSGMTGHGKLLYALDTPLASKKIIKNEKTIYEYRCCTADGLTVQDVLPPSVHPTTLKKYKWSGKGSLSKLPRIPESLLENWKAMLTITDQKFGAVGENKNFPKIDSALSKIPPDCPRDEWISIGMALHWVGSYVHNLPEFFKKWDEWSAKSTTKYPGQLDLLTQWKSFKSDKSTSITHSTLFHIASRYGWTENIDASSLFNAPAASKFDTFNGFRPAPPQINIDLFPEILKTRANEISTSVGCDVLVPLFAGLGAICGVVDSRIRLELLPGFQVPPILWLMTIGDPADKKTPGSKPMLTTLRSIEVEDHARYQKDALRYEGMEAAYASAKKSFLEWSASPDSLLGDDAPHVPDVPVPPVPLKLTVSDITSQKLVRQAADRPRGLLCYLDEMSSWITKLTDNRSGEDRSAWVVSYEGSYYEMDRVGSGSIRCENLAVSIFGNIQPKIFKNAVKSLSADGLLQRFIPGVLSGKNTKLGKPIPDFLSCSKKWEGLLRLIFALPQRTYRLSDEATRAFREFQQWYEEAKQDERILNPETEYMTAFGKLEGLAGRLILIFHIIESPFSSKVDADIVHRVVDFIRGYIIPSYRYLFGELSGTDTFDQWLTEHIIQISPGIGELTLTDIKNSARRQLHEKTEVQKIQMIIDSMANLQRSGWVAAINDHESNYKLMRWVINPKLKTMFQDYRERVYQAKQRNLDYIYRNFYEQGAPRRFVKRYDQEQEKPD